MFSVDADALIILLSILPFSSLLRAILILSILPLTAFVLEPIRSNDKAKLLLVIPVFLTISLWTNCPVALPTNSPFTYNAVFKSDVLIVKFVHLFKGNS